MELFNLRGYRITTQGAKNLSRFFAVTRDCDDCFTAFAIAKAGMNFQVKEISYKKLISLILGRFEGCQL